MQVSHDNHFVPQWYLKHWTDRHRRFWRCALLVSHPSVPLWQRCRPRGVAFQRDLYTSIKDDQDLDDFEKWIEAEFEAPAKAAVQHAVRGEPLSSTDWERLAMFAVAQDLRTPQNFIESMQRWDREMPQLLRQTLERLVQQLEEHARTGEPLPPQSGIPGVCLSGILKVQVRPNARPETSQSEIRVDVLLGRQLWLEEQRHALNGVGKIAIAHRWSIAEPAAGMEWFTSDHPLLRLNYYGPGVFDFRGGWESTNGNICMPLSPKTLLFTQIGADLPPRMVLGQRESCDIRTALAQRGYRSIFAREPIPGIEKLRARVVDRAAYEAEQAVWKRWHTEQSRAQREHDRGQ